MVSEANVFKLDHDHEVNIEGYQMVKAKGFNSLGHSRLVVLVRDELNI